MEEKFLTKKEVAALFEITERTLERWVQQGKVPPGRRSGRKVFWKKADCEQALRFMQDDFEQGLDRQFRRWRGSILNG